MSTLTSLVWESAHIVPALIKFAMQLSIAAFHSFKSFSVSVANMYVRWAVMRVNTHNDKMTCNLASLLHIIIL